MSQIEIKINHPLPYAKAVFVFLKQERDNDNIYLIYPLDDIRQFTNSINIDSTYPRSLTYEAKRDLIAMRETLKTVFEVNGMDFEKDNLTDYPLPNKGRYFNESSKV